MSSGLLLAGAPRVILALSAVPVALTLRSAMTRRRMPPAQPGRRRVEPP
jgi:hypothetical protein